MALILHHLLPWRFGQASASCALSPCTGCGGEGQGYFPPCVRWDITGWCLCGCSEIFSLSLWRLHDSKHLNLTCRFSCKGACHYSPKYLRKFLVSHLENGSLMALCVRRSEAVPESQLASHDTFPVVPRPPPLWPEEERPGPPWRSHERLRPWT